MLRQKSNRVETSNWRYMGYIVDIEELHDNQEVIISQLEQWSSAFAGLSEAENTYIMNTEVFGGQAAQAAKEYVSAVHQTLGGTYCQMFDETRSLLLLYVDGYQAIEDSIIGRISEESLEEQQRLIQREQQTLSEIDGQIKGAIASVAHIVSVINPDAESIIQNYTLMSTFLSELDGNIKAYEESHANDMNRVGELLDGISRVMDIHKGTDVHIAPYSDIQTCEGVQLLTLINKIGEGDPTLISAAERVNSLYDEFCTNRISEERMEKGAKAVVGGSLLVLTGIVTAVFISRTAGAAIIGKGGTIVMGAASYVAVTHGTSNTLEGFQEYRYGKSRDTESIAINYVRDYAYLGNERLYNGVTTVGETVCGAYLTGMYGCMYSQACGIPLWKGELIQGGIALASGEAGAFVSDKVSTLDVNPWLKATAGPVAGVAAFGVANATATKYIVPSIKQANIIGNVESNRSITEIAKTDTIMIDTSLSEQGRAVYGPYYEEALRLYVENPDFFPDPDQCSIVQGEEYSKMRIQYERMVASGQLERGHHIQGIAFGGENTKDNIVFTGESTIKREYLPSELQNEYYEKGYTNKKDYRIVKIVEDNNGSINHKGKNYSFGLNQNHTKATNFQKKVIKWQREVGVRE